MNNNLQEIMELMYGTPSKKEKTAVISFDFE